MIEIQGATVYRRFDGNMISVNGSNTEWLVPYFLKIFSYLTQCSLFYGGLYNIAQKGYPISLHMSRELSLRQ